jgi:hypothetical protein
MLFLPFTHPYLGPVLLCEKAQITVVSPAESFFSKMENNNAVIAQNIFGFMTVIREKINFIFAVLGIICLFFAETEVMFCSIQQGTCSCLKFCMLSLFLITVQICGSEGAR